MPGPLAVSLESPVTGGRTTPAQATAKATANVAARPQVGGILHLSHGRGS